MALCDTHIVEGVRPIVGWTHRFVDAVEGADDHDLRWRCSLLAALSIALADAGDPVGAASRALTSFQHAEALLRRAMEAADAGRAVVKEVRSILRRIVRDASVNTLLCSMHPR